MAKLKLDDVKRALLKLVVHYPEAGHTGETIALISEDYHNDLVGEGVTLQQFHDAVNLTRKTCGFFPKVKDLIDAWREVCTNPPPRNDNLQIAADSIHHDPTPEELAFSQKIFAIAGLLARGEITAAECVERQEKLKAEQEKQFSGRLRVVRG